WFYYDRYYKTHVLWIPYIPFFGVSEKDKLGILDMSTSVCVVFFVVVTVSVVSNKWMLSDPLCDAWVASDVLACTASILNLTAISVDRSVIGQGLRTLVYTERCLPYHQ
ncbi:5-hydroxytryptamine receptor 7, partial [Bulinus truncatus]